MGLLPSLGIHHASQVNAFNLADDLFEPFRPFTDELTSRLTMDRNVHSDLTKEDRHALAALPLRDIVFRGEVMTMLAATERSAESLARAFDSGDAKDLHLPVFVPATVKTEAA